MIIQKWDTHEVELRSTTRYDNPFTDVEVSVSVTHEGGRSFEVGGFYDGDGTWRFRFMPDAVGGWTYRTTSTDTELNGVEGQIACVEPTESYLRGPIVCRDNHFFHADGSPRFVLSTRLSCHWAEPSEWLEAIDYLKAHRINRVLFIMGGVHGTVEQLYGPDRDFDRYDLPKFQAIDRFIDCLRRADVLASPYFYYFNDKSQRGLTPEQDRAYVRYGMSRFGAYSNVMPVLSNEVDQKFTDRKGEYDLRSHEWANEMGVYMKGLAVSGVPVSVHNPMETDNATNPGFYTLLYDWPFPWTDFMLRQAQVAALSCAPVIADDVPENKGYEYNVRGFARHNQLMIDLARFGNPVVNEEPGYEMEGRTAKHDSTDVNMRPWNSQNANSLVSTFWGAATGGGYVMWGNFDTYQLDSPLSGIRRTETPKRLRILHDVMLTMPYWEMKPSNSLVSANEVEFDGEGFRSNYCLAKPGEVYLVFSELGGELELELAPGNYALEQIDPKTGTRKDLGDVEGGNRSVKLDGAPQVLIARKT